MSEIMTRSSALNPVYKAFPMTSLKLLSTLGDYHDKPGSYMDPTEVPSAQSSRTGANELDVTLLIGPAASRREHGTEDGARVSRRVATCLLKFGHLHVDFRTRDPHPPIEWVSCYVLILPRLPRRVRYSGLYPS